MTTSTVIDCTSQLLTVQDTLPTPRVHHPRLSGDKSARKRKHDQLDEFLENWRPFTIQTVQPTSDGQNQPLTPRLLLPRSCLPLAYLEPNVNGELSSGSRLFTAQIELLEADKDGLQLLQPAVLAAQNESSGRFYAIEKVHNGVYVLCRLGAWVTEDALRRLADASPSYTARPQCIGRHELDPPASEWWRPAAVPSRTGPHVPIRANDPIARARDFKLSLKRPLKRNLSPIPTRRTSAPKSPQNLTLGGGQITDEGLQKPGDVLKLIKTQYLEALYLSRTSLAYFAKGSLSRARASFQRQDGSARDSSELTQYLRTMILTLPVMDKKYRESIPTLVKEYPFSMLSDGECASIIETTKKKSRKSQKDKINKNGLYAGEDINIAQWWLGRDMQCLACDTHEAREESIKTTILEQRAREAQLQIIILLETLALEANAIVPGGKSLRADKAGLEHDDATTKVKKSKKPQDLYTLLDLLADRLCIWHSMTAEVEKPSANQNQQSSSQKKTENKNDDHLRQFCIDVILPFYGARLPEVSALLCQKLGGPKEPSPKRLPPATLEAMTKVSVKPGAPIPRPQSRKPRPTLERVLTDDKSRHRRQTPSLSRSVTEPVLQLKREVSDASLSSIPLNKVAMPKRYTQREVDLRAASQTTESKHKKKMNVEQELQGAIAAIKKPNPKMAGREFVEAVEKRLASSRSRKPKNPIRNSFAQGLQVMATPSRNKYAAPYKLSSLAQTQHATTCETDDLLPPSVSRIIPSSTQKAQASIASSDNHINRSDQQPIVHVDQTPTKGSAGFFDDSSFPMGGESAVVRSFPPRLPTSLLKPPDDPSGSLTWKSIMQRTPSKKPDQEQQTSPLLEPNLQATPSKQPLSKAPLFEATSPSSRPEELDLYTCLGWNYDVDD